MNKQKQENGSALIVALLLVMITSGIVAIAVSFTTQTARFASRTRSQETSVAIGDAYLDCAFAQWRAACQKNNTTQPSGSDFTPEQMTVPPSALLAKSGSFKVSNFRIVALNGINSGPNHENQWGDDAPIALQQGTDGCDNSYLYLATADVSVSAIGGTPVTSKVRRAFEKRVESPWKYAIFFNDRMEIHPGKNMVINGRVHGNGDVYALAAGMPAGQMLTFQDRVTFAGNYLETYADGDAQRRQNDKKTYNYTGPDDPRIQALQKPSYASPPSADSRKDPFGISPLQFDPSDNNPNNDGYRELIERPVAGFSDPFNGDSENQRFYYQAGLKILVDNNTLTILRKDGSKVDSNTYNAVVGAMTTGESFQDNREGGAMAVTTLDIGALKAGISKSSDWNGIVYISDINASPTNKRGIRLKNGSELPSKGLTVASDNPIYIQGDYNTSQHWQPAAVAGDAVNILSNSWTDSNSSAGLAHRTASETTVNTAILSGVVPTQLNPSDPKNSTYSGGVENFPRLLEDWTNKSLTYRGSMVQMFNSQQAIGVWGQGNVYNAPNRAWSFDTRLRTSPPPGVFLVVSYSRGRWYLD